MNWPEGGHRGEPGTPWALRSQGWGDIFSSRPLCWETRQPPGGMKFLVQDHGVRWKAWLCLPGDQSSERAMCHLLLPQTS